MRSSHHYSPRTDPPSLTAYLTEQVGESLQAVWWRTPTDHRLRYLRPGLPQATAGTWIDVFEERLCEGSTPNPPTADLGGWQATLDVWDHSIALYLPRGGNCGYVVSLDPVVGANLASFVAECQRQIERD